MPIDYFEKVIKASEEEAALFRREYVRTEHLLCAVFKVHDPFVNEICKQLNCGFHTVRNEIIKIVGHGSFYVRQSRMHLSPRSLKILEIANRASGSKQAKSEHFLFALLNEKNGLAYEILKNLGMDKSLPPLLKDVVEFEMPKEKDAEISNEETLKQISDILLNQNINSEMSLKIIKELVRYF